MKSSLERHAARQAETYITAAQALAWAEDYYEQRRKWPRARYRVEGGVGGSSRLLTTDEATATVSRYGGRIVELIPSREDYLAKQKGTAKPSEAA